MSDPRYPIGTFVPQENYTPAELSACIERIATLPQRLAAAAGTLTDAQLDTPYRDGGWTLRQVIHHVADSHMNAYIRLKWTLTEETPLIKAYNEKDWAQTPETKAPTALSLQLLSALHAKWTTLLRQIGPSDWQRSFLHPETNKHVRLDRQVALYAWHGDHHLGHVTSLKERMGWK